MADLRLQRRIEEGDREALEHIARALEGRVLPGPGATSPVPETNGQAKAETAKPDDAKDPLVLAPEGLEVLLEAMPAAIGILKRGTHLYQQRLRLRLRLPVSFRALGGGRHRRHPARRGRAATGRGYVGRTEEVDALTRSRRR
ncbi:hypothetical protein, partial [Methyloceanibacter marginalis]|uniref:hypothetical protein n=1 Tax=Methyloceanibacter marginalis TaxID=1774971 RepID=UPI00114D1AB5